jgi:ABC-type multidrug transport system fused ATPase/permease subunit
MKNFLARYREQFQLVRYFLRPKLISAGVLTILTFGLGFLEMLNVLAIFPILLAGVDTVSGEQVSNPSSGLIAEALSSMARGLNLSELLVASLILLLITIFTFVYKVLYTWFEHKAISDLLLIHKRKFFETLEFSSPGGLGGIKRGELNQLGSSSMEAVGILLDYIAKFISQASTLILLIVLIANGGLVLLITLISLGFFYFLLMKHVSKVSVQKYSKDIHEIKIAESHVLNEVFTGIETIRNYGAINLWKRRFHALAESLKSSSIKINIGYLLPGALLQLLMGIGMASFGVYLSRLSSDQILQIIPIIGVFIIAVSRTNASLSGLVNSYAVIVAYYPPAKNLYNFMKNSQHSGGDEGSVNFNKFEKSIVFSNVSFNFSEKSQNILDRINIEIKRGGSVAIVGGSGSGKTTLINLMLGNYVPTSGRIIIDGLDINNIKKEQYRKRFAVVSQDSFLMSGTLIDNINFGANYSLSEIKEALQRANAIEFVENLPQKLNTMVGEGGVRLSGGQTQRISLARALLRRPDILILDEPTSSLDSKNEGIVFQNVNELSKQMTIIIVTHSLTLSRMCDRIISLEDMSTSS